MTPAQRQIVLDGLTAQFSGADVARPIANSIAVQFPNPNPAGFVAVRSSDVVAYVMTTL